MRFTTLLCLIGVLGSLLLLSSCGSGDGDDPVAPTPPPAVGIETALKVSDTSYRSATVFPVKQGGSGSGVMRVRLAAAPTATVTVTVTRSAGDADQVIYDLATHVTLTTYALTFTTANWNQWQPVYFVTLADTDSQLAAATFSVTGSAGSGIVAKSVSAFPAMTADATVSGTIVRQGFVAKAVDFTDPVADIAFTLSWKKTGTGSDARYYGTYTDNDPLNQLPDGTAGNEARTNLSYPAYGFWNGADLYFVAAKSILTQRASSETNLIVLRATSEAFASGTGYVTATGSASTTIGSYAVSFSAAAATAEQLIALLPLANTAEYPLYTANLQAQTYTPGSISAVSGQWDLDPDATDRYLVDGVSKNGSGTVLGDVHGIVTGSYDGSGRPNMLGVLNTSTGFYLFGLPFYSPRDPTDANFPFGTMGGRFVNATDGMTDRIFLFLSFPSG